MMILQEGTPACPSVLAEHGGGTGLQECRCLTMECQTDIAPVSPTQGYQWGARGVERPLE